MTIVESSSLLNRINEIEMFYGINFLNFLRNVETEILGVGNVSLYT